MTQFDPVFGEWLLDYGYVIATAVGIIVVSILVISNMRRRVTDRTRGNK